MYPSPSLTLLPINLYYFLGTKLKILSDHKGWVNGVAWTISDSFPELSAGNGSNNRGGSLATIASDRCLRVYNTSTKSYKNVAKTHRCKLKVPVSKRKQLDDQNDGEQKPVNAAVDSKKSEPQTIIMDDRNVRMFHDDTFPSFYRRLDFSPDGM